ncbi:hypothetical protein BB559_006960 [Furculomyces boomerangus]|uniref:C2H2-type domain-containing protein n=1 Tax=Furculomyces boomerangus TaxID=61424 RepID=A0A2T9XZP1_9FUNG|nr:hypothetical protein BB559_006960 [Furculomyces boomerangus]
MSFSLMCEWDSCNLGPFNDPDALYNHLTNEHVGRKAKGNLCLDCKWHNCNVKTFKRDHITSHLRVHIPLKPHECRACKKTFKRPQDLKKHEKKHEEISLKRSSPNQHYFSSSDSHFYNDRNHHISGIYSNNCMENEYLYNRNTISPAILNRNVFENSRSSTMQSYDMQAPPPLLAQPQSTSFYTEKSHHGLQNNPPLFGIKKAKTFSEKTLHTNNNNLYYKNEPTLLHRRKSSQQTIKQPPTTINNYDVSTDKLSLRNIR